VQERKLMRAQNSGTQNFVNGAQTMLRISDPMANGYQKRKPADATKAM
jgi:hypothetical protein